jgi:hypothetical protein
MTTIVNKICQSETFIKMLEEKISEDINGEDGSVVDYNEGRVDGHVIDYTIVSDIIFKSSTVEGFTLELELEFTGDATINYKRVGTDEEYDDKTLQGLGTAIVSVAVPSDILTIENVEDIIKDLEIEVGEFSAYLTEEDEIDEKALNEAEESFNEYIERRSTFESLSIDALIDKIISLEDKVMMLEKISDKDTPS